MRIFHSAHELLESIGPGCVFVPTMGALHEGHLSLIRIGGSLAGPGGVVASVFVNPTQFDDPSDLERYPRRLEQDAAACEAAGAMGLYAPPTDEVYPPGALVEAPPLPAVATEPGLEDRARPGHLLGVAQVVTRLFDLVQPRAAVFGEKDYQQIQMVRWLAGRRAAPVEIVAGATVREEDGLAMASRNQRLTQDERAMAAAIPEATLRVAPAHADAAEAERAMRETMERAGLVVEYAAVRDGETLLAPEPGRPARALVAARTGGTRLIDNAPWEPHA